MTEERFAQFWERLQNRTVRQIRSLHYLQYPGFVLCLDLDLRAESQAALNAAVVAWLAGSQLDAILPYADRSLWRVMADKVPPGADQTRAKYSDSVDFIRVGRKRLEVRINRVP